MRGSIRAMSTENPAEPQFKEGDRVQVLEEWFVVEQRGETGTIIPGHKGCKDLRSEGVYWVSFDRKLDPQKNGAWNDSAEIDAECLRKI